MPRERARTPDAPVTEVLDAVVAALADVGAAVLVASPGTGKTTLVPPALADAGDRRALPGGRIVVVVPRRMAARAAAARMAHLHGSRVGGRFGYSVRHDSRSGRDTRVEVVTPGLLLRRLQADPALTDVASVVLDEFHERSVDLDLLLALLLDARAALRPDLALLAMSATLDAAPVAELLGGAPVLAVESPLHPVETLHRPGSAHDRLGDRVAAVAREALAERDGDVLVFLPGRAEIRAAARALGQRGVAGGTLEVCELHGSTPPGRTDEILSPASHRRVILSSAVAETSLTVPGVRVVVDAGWSRHSELDRSTGLPGLVTRKVSMAAADQRRGRAGREGPGTCYRLWDRREEETRRATDPPEITVADLSELLLAVLDWGTRPGSLAWLDAPPQDSLSRAAELLGNLGALRTAPRDSGDADGDGFGGRLTRLGRRLAELGFHPRIGAIAAIGTDRGEPDLAAEVAAVLETEGSGHLEVAEGVRALRDGRAPEPLRRSVRQWRRQLGSGGAGSGSGGAGDDLEREVGRLVLAGYADRLARRRDGRTGVYHLRSGAEVTTRGSTGLGEWLVAVALDARSGSGAPGLLHLAAPVHADDAAEVVRRAEEDGSLTQRSDIRWDPTTGAVHTDTTRRLGSLVVGTTTTRGAGAPGLADAVSSTLARSGPQVLPGWEDTAGLRGRLAFVRETGVPCPSRDRGWPDLSERAVRSDPHWLAETIVAVATAATGTGDPLMVDGNVLSDVFGTILTFGDRTVLDEEAPVHWRVPGGRDIRLEYGVVDGDPASVLLSCRLQDLLGLDSHPCVGGSGFPAVVELLSPAGRPLQRTTDLPGFWRGSYSEVRAEMRGRYPKHRWPEEPWRSDS